MYASFLSARPALLRLFVLLVTLLLAGPGRGWAQVPAWAQAVSFAPSGGSGYSEGRATATDAAGNQYVTGLFDGTLVLGNTTLVAVAFADVFVAKRSAAGAWLWAVRAGGSGNDVSSGVAVDAGGNALVTGSVGVMASFGTSPAPTVLPGVGSANVFVAKFGATTGVCTWVVEARGSGYDTGNGVAVDASGNALVTGTFQGTINFATTPTATSLPAMGVDDVFVAKFGAGTGACAWAVRAGGSGRDGGAGIATDANGNALVTGDFQTTASFGTSPVPTSLVAVGGYDVFVAKFGAGTGVCAWAVRAGGSGQDDGNGIAVDAGGNALVTGDFQTTANFGTGPAAIALASVGSYDVFVAKFGASTGACAWAVPAGGSGYDNSIGVAADAGGNALVTGSFEGTARFGAGSVPTSLLSAGNSDVFVAKFGAGTGACAWAVGAGGSGSDAGYGTAVDAGGNAVVSGNFQLVANFGNLALVGNSGSSTLTGFLAVLGGAGTLPTRAPAPGPAFTLFPNPARRACQVQGTPAGAEVTVYDALGRPLAHAPADAAGTARLALPDGLAPGLYLVRSGGQVQRLAVE